MATVCQGVSATAGEATAVRALAAIEVLRLLPSLSLMYGVCRVLGPGCVLVIQSQPIIFTPKGFLKRRVAGGSTDPTVRNRGSPCCSEQRESPERRAAVVQEMQQLPSTMLHSITAQLSKLLIAIRKPCEQQALRAVLIQVFSAAAAFSEDAALRQDELDGTKRFHCRTATV